MEASYLINKGYIAKYLCENKDKPKMNCCGKCFLKKQLKKQNKEEQSANFKKSDLKVQLFVSPDCVVIHEFFLAKETSFYISNHAGLAKFPRSIFHPPAV